MSLTSEILLRAEQTGGAIGAVEISVPAGWEGPPLHHHAFDEAFYVLEGELTFQLGDELAVAGPGGFPGPPLHRHAFDELFYVLDGELTFQLGDELLTRRAGEPAFAPRGAHHTFANRSGAGARTLIVCTPAGFERYFARMAAERAGVEPSAWALQPTPEVVRVGPQIGAAG
jgi:quercetin dioxygenase-like cupin family protein